MVCRFSDTQKCVVQEIIKSEENTKTGEIIATKTKEKLSLIYLKNESKGKSFIL